MSERPILLQANHLKKWFPVRKGVFSKAAQYVKAVDDVSLVIREGETLGIVGGVRLREIYPGPHHDAAHRAHRGHGPFSGSGSDQCRQGEPAPDAPGYPDHLSRSLCLLNPRQRVSDILAEPFLIHKLGSREAAMKRAEELLDLVGLSQDSMRKFPMSFPAASASGFVLPAPCPSVPS